jgi:benzylsuccinate CoA-transferase BbsE subunit
VLELAEDAAGELTGLHLAQLGADVLKLEPPEGGSARRRGPFATGTDGEPVSLAHVYYNAGKQSEGIDLTSPDGQQRFTTLLAAADVLISTRTPNEWSSIGHDLTELAASHERLVVVSITPFGLTGPWSHYRGADLVTMAAGGLLIMNGYDDHTVPPIRPGGDQALHTAASYAHIAVALALLQREQSGRGGLIDVSVHEAAGLSVEIANPYWFYPRVHVHRQTCRHAQPVPTQPGLFRCADGRWVYFLLILSEPSAWRSLVEWMARKDLAVDLVETEYDDLAHRQANFSHVQELLEIFFMLQDAATAARDGQAHGLPIGVVNAPEDLYADEHLAARDFFVPVEQPGLGPIQQPRSPFRFSRLATLAPRPAPGLPVEAARPAG